MFLAADQLKVPMSCFIPFVFEEEKKIVKRSNLTQRSKIEKNRAFTPLTE
jgi:hypothetical protein